jgi:hypothetical protein
LSKLKNTDEWRELQSRLHLPATALQYLETLPEAEARTLCGAILAAEEKQRFHLNSAVEHAVRHVPAPFRGAVRRLLLDD